MGTSRGSRLSRGAVSLDAALVGVGADVAAPPLARLGHDLSRRDLGPADAFRRDLRQQLVTSVSSPAPVPARRGAARERAAAAHPARWFAVRLTAGLAAAGVMVTGVGVASARALPGDALYGVKRDAESVQLDLARGDSARGILHLQFAASRLSEVHALLNRAGLADPTAPKRAGSPTVVPRSLAATLRSTLTAMDVDTSTGASELTQSYLHKRQSASLTKLAAFTTQQETALTSVLPALPAPAAAASLHVLHTVAAQTTALLAEPAGQPAAAPAVAPSDSPSPTAASTSATPAESPASPTPAAGATPSASAESSADPTPLTTASSSPTAEPRPTTATTAPSSSPAAASDSPSPDQSPTPVVSPTTSPEPSPTVTP